jgi:hypothetical protein
MKPGNSENRFDEAVKEKLIRHTVLPRSRNWEAINRHLNGLEGEKKKRFIILFLFLSLTSVVVSFFTDERQTNTATDNSNSVAGKIVEMSNEAGIEIASDHEKSDGSVERFFEPEVRNETNLPALNHSNDSQISKIQSGIQRLKAPTATRAPILTQLRIKSAKHQEKKIYLSAGCALQNTWLIDKVPVNGINYRPTLHMAYQARIGYRLNVPLVIEAGLNFSTQGQSYTYHSAENRFAGSDRKNLRLQYLQVPVQAKVQMRRVNVKSSDVLQFGLGVQYGRLIHSETLIGGKKIVEHSSLNRNEASVLAGVDFQTTLSPKISLELFARASMGTPVASRAYTLDFEGPANVVFAGGISVLYW